MPAGKLLSRHQLSDTEKKLYELGANEKKGIKFYSDRWELPQS